MVFIHRTEKPAELTEPLQEQLLAEYIENPSKRVWDKPFIKQSLIEMSQGKCSYCERKIGSGSGDVHIDHFHPKKLYPEEVISWANLLPACADCNRSKSDHDTVTEPIIDPSKMDPRKYFYLKDFRYKAIDTDLNSIANVTIDVLNLNDLEKKSFVRFQVTTAILNKLAETLKNVKENISSLKDNTRKRNRIVNIVRDILKNCVSTAEFSAFNATAVQNDMDYKELKKLINDLGWWNDELENLDQQSKKCVFMIASQEV